MMTEAKRTKEPSIDGEVYQTKSGEWRGRCLIVDCGESEFPNPESLQDHIMDEHCVTRKPRIRGWLSYENWQDEQRRVSEAPTIDDVQRERKLRQAAMDLLENQDWLDQLWSRMDQHIKYDKSIRRILLKVMVSALALKKPMNATMKAPSSFGKTYLATEVGRYLPPELIEYLEGMTPKNIYYEYGEWDEENKVKILNLQGKIWVFLDIPDMDTLRFIKAMMSHDTYERVYKTVIEQKSVKIVLRGFATVIACTTSPKYNEEMSTRALQITPEHSAKKIESAIELFYKQCANPGFQVETADIQMAIRLLSESKRIPRFPQALDYAQERIQEIKDYRKLRPRDMRDLKWLPNLAMVTAWLNQRHRLANDEFIDVTEEDWKAALEDWKPIHKTTTTGLTDEQIKFLDDLEKDKEYSARELQKIDQKANGRYRSYDTLKRRVLDPLNYANYIDWEPDPNDKRRYLFRKISAINSEKTENDSKQECDNEKDANHESGNLRENNNNRRKSESKGKEKKSANQKHRINQILKYISELSQESIDHSTSPGKIIERAALDGISRDAVLATLDHLRGKGKITQPKPNIIRLVDSKPGSPHTQPKEKKT